MKIYESHRYVGKFQSLFGKPMIGFIDKLMLVVSGNVYIDLAKFDEELLKFHDEYMADDSIEENTRRIYGDKAVELIKKFI